MLFLFVYASLFACMIGLRISDTLKLQWSYFEMGPIKATTPHLHLEKQDRRDTTH